MCFTIVVTHEDADVDIMLCGRGWDGDIACTIRVKCTPYNVRCKMYAVQCTSCVSVRRTVCNLLSDRRTLYIVHLHCMQGIYSHTIRQLLCLHMYMRVYVGTYLYVCVCVW